MMDAFKNRLLKTYKHRKKWATRQGLSCFRLYDKDLPDVPCIVDYLDGDIVVWAYARTKDDSEALILSFEQSLTLSIEAAFPNTPVHLKRRYKLKGLQTQYERSDQSAYIKHIEECGLTFELNLSDYVDTGLFLDHRRTRDLVRKQAKGQRLLNLFAYTGSFTCYAIDGFADSSVTVDLNPNYSEWTRRNFHLNGFEDSDKHQIITADCMDYLHHAKDEEPFDIIVCDPPTFSNSKRAQAASFSVNNDYVALIQGCMARLKKDGILYFSCNSRQFVLEAERLSGAVAIDISAITTSEDFKTSKAHRCWEIKHA
jgi:23S rRNA G2069 N7-methylase RlmK/C1962 C5-methylase RlmI